MNNRACAIIVDQQRLLLMKRIKDGREYYCFPGGSVEEAESIEDAVRREVQEELSLAVRVGSLLFTLVNQGRKEFYFRIESFSGNITLGSPEAERQSATNQYIPTWVPLEEIRFLDNLVPSDARSHIIHYRHL